MMPDDETTNILLVDDLPEKLLAYTSILEELGQNLVIARSGEEALRQVLRTEFAVILLDVQMPGMDGFETAALIRKRRRSAHTPIIFLTAFADEVRAAEGYAHGAVDYIPTPAVPEILRAKVRVFVDLYRMTQRVKRQAEEQIALAEEQTKRAAAEEATRRLGFLADVSRALADSLDPDTTARTLARQAVPFLADLASVTLAGEPGQPWRTELAWDAPGVVPETRRLMSPEAPHDDLRAAVERALADGKSAHLDGLDIPYPTALDGAAPPAGHIRSAAVVPLRARGRILGTLVLAHGPSGRRHGVADLALAEDLAGRAAIALDNARLYRDVEHADRQKNEFLSMLAHELRNPLAPIRTAVELLRVRVPDQPDVRKVRDIIDRQVAHMVRLVDDLLDVSRITRGKIQLQVGPTDLATVVEQAVEASRPVIDRFRHHLVVSLPPDPVWVAADQARLAQVVTNLLNNAAKYTDAGGDIRLSVGRAYGGDAEIRVRDNGIGLPPDMLSKVFDLFTQVDRTMDRSQGGLGVGLTLVRRLVELHGGTVRAHSEGPGRGSEFVVRLPALCGAPDAPVPVSRSAATPTRLPRVLLVDDNADGAETLSVLLRAAGYDVCTAHDGPGGVTAALAQRPDVVLMDIGLPGLDGYEAARRLRAAPEMAGVVLVALTGYGRDEDRDLARQAGFDHHLIKPVEFTTLRELLDAVGPRRPAGL